MDLIATVTPIGHASGQKTKDVVDVWRLNGQRVFGATFEKADDQDGDGDGDLAASGDRRRGTLQENDDKGKDRWFVTAVSWRRDGQILAVACADGTVSLINAFTGKIAHRLNAPRSLPASPNATMSFNSSPSSQPQASGSSSSGSKSVSPPLQPVTVTAISWTKHFAFPTGDKVRSRLEGSGTPVSLDQLLGLKADMDQLLNVAADLPQALASIDVEDSLPKIATLPPLGAAVDDDVFSSRASIDAIFHSDGSAASGGSAVGDVNALLTGLLMGDGSCAIDLKIFDSFEIGAIDIEGSLRTLPGRRRVIKFDSHPFLSTVFLIIEQADPQGVNVTAHHLVSLDLSFIPRTGSNLPLVARKATRLGNLLRYISQIQMQLASEVKAAFELPARFLRNINQALAEGDPSADFSYAAHHLAVNGECFPHLKEWLVDEVGERGLKRWEKAVGDCLDLVRRMTSENLMPALERCHVILDRLHGLAMYGPTSSKLGLNEHNVAKIIETTDALTIFAEDLLLDVAKEVKEFTAFMKWMKFECEVEALEESSERAEELREAWTGENEVMAVLEYVSGAMAHSRLWKYVDSTTNDHLGEGSAAMAAITADTDAGFLANYVKRRSDGKPLPVLEEMIEQMQKQSDVVFEEIAETFRKSILATYITQYPRCDGEKMDTRVIPDQGDVSLYHLMAIAKDPKERDLLHMVSTTLRFESGNAPRIEDNVNISTTVSDVDEILDAKIVDDKTILVLVAHPADIRIYQMGIKTDLEYEVWELRHVFTEGRMHAGQEPARLEVNGREGRRAVTVVDEAGMGYLVLDMDGEA
ncbi:hypothetical protein A1O1_04207 [Capronia coronata CBS 617.96]|uniref:Anaphase-promoting complex subunit 4 n=1 Tax=Capronia coronata CBS 617.96 TaxID=1182541 RepID=W9YN42_9EURO|nr:uncharacterized protein A1O1_04207 [Capronia coronata CBS 617.96]EXJ91100.1 hypothetical protein A1O1_04207 [Capronia coronata CBS 617.96]